MDKTIGWIDIIYLLKKIKPKFSSNIESKYIVKYTVRRDSEEYEKIFCLPGELTTGSLSSWLEAIKYRIMEEEMWATESDVLIDSPQELTKGLLARYSIQLLNKLE